MRSGEKGSITKANAFDSVSGTKFVLDRMAVGCHLGTVYLGSIAIPRFLKGTEGEETAMEFGVGSRNAGMDLLIDSSFGHGHPLQTTWVVLMIPSSASAYSRPSIQ